MIRCTLKHSGLGLPLLWLDTRGKRFEVVNHFSRTRISHLVAQQSVFPRAHPRRHGGQGRCGGGGKA